MSPHNLKVLIIEPDQEKSNALAAALESLEITQCQQTQHVRNIAKIMGAPSVDLVFLGSDAPDSSTEEALRFIKHHPEHKSMPCLWYTSNSEPERARNLISQGIVDVVNYPIDLPQLKSALRNYFRIVNSREISKLIRRASFFKEFTSEELQTLVKVSIPRRFKAGESVITRGDPADKFYILLKGKIEVKSVDAQRKTREILIQEGSPFGEMAVIDNSPRSACCVALEESLVLEIGAHIITDVNYNLRLRIFASLAVIMSRRLRRMNGLMQELQRNFDNLTTRWDEEVNLPPLEEVLKPKEEGESAGGKTTFAPSGEQATLPTPNPYAASSVPSAMADSCTLLIRSQEEYDILLRKVALRTEFITSRIPSPTVEVICNKLMSYWTSSKLAKFNPHVWWNPDSFIPGTHKLKQSLHLVVVAPEGEQAYKACFLGLPVTHRVITQPQTGCMGTLLGSETAIQRYLEGRWLESAIHLDLEMPIDRSTDEKSQIEFLMHTPEDLRGQSLFLVFDNEEGKYTKLVREKFPKHQIVTVVPGLDFNPEDLSTLFSLPEQKLKDNGILVSKDEYIGRGFYGGQTYFLPDLSVYYKNADALSQWGYLFGTIGVLSKLGPELSDVSWGSRGGAEGALKATRAMLGQKATMSQEDISSAINWADQ